MSFFFSLCINNTEERFEFHAGGEGGKNKQSCTLKSVSIWEVCQYFCCAVCVSVHINSELLSLGSFSYTEPFPFL